MTTTARSFLGLLSLIVILSFSAVPASAKVAIGNNHAVPASSVKCAKTEGHKACLSSAHPATAKGAKNSKAGEPKIGLAPAHPASGAVGVAKNHPAK